MNKQSAFTLAEVLITLAIIGVVAAMTIPTLMSNTGKSEFKTAYKKTFAALNQAVTMNIALDYFDFADTESGNGDLSLFKMLQKRMNVMKTLSAAANTTMHIPATNYTLFLSDGQAISFPTSIEACVKSNACEGIIDTNGEKKPNKLSNCATAPGSATSTVTTDAAFLSGTTSCNDDTNLYIGDQFSIKFQHSEVVPNGKAANYVLYAK